MKIASSVAACVYAAGMVASARLTFGPPNAAPSAASAAPIVYPARGGAFGTLKGRLVYGGEAPALPIFAGAADKEFCKDQMLVDRALQVDPKTKGIAHAFVYLVAPTGKNADAEKALIAKAATVRIDNRNCEFVPRNTALHKDQTLEFTNNDPVGHNSHYTPVNQIGKNPLVPANGQVSIGKLKPERNVIPLKCDVHPWMQGYIMVFDHPFFAVTGGDGTFEIAGIPAGTRNVVVWQEKVGFVTANRFKGVAVEIKANEAVDMGDVILDPAKVK